MTAAVAIFGATGYTGQELVTLLDQHPQAEIKSVTSESSQGKRLCDVTSLRHGFILETTASAVARIEPGTTAFLCLPHGESEPVAQSILQNGGRVIDLSADFRMIPKASQESRPLVQLPKQKTAAIRYGLCELERLRCREQRCELSDVALIANPGCYPTSVLLPLIPLLREKMISADSIIIDSKSGTSGAGRAAKASLLLAEIHEDFSAYSPGRSHRHVPEINGYLEYYSGHKTNIVFTPHLLPISRGILSTIYCRLNASSIQKTNIIEAWQRSYSSSPFVWIFAEDLPSIGRVTRTNRCAMGCVVSGDTLIVVSAIDNLLKGAAGQAVQNFNQMIGLDDQAGLEGIV